MKCSAESTLEIMRQIYKGKALRMIKLDSVTSEDGSGDIIFTMALPATDEEIADFICGDTVTPDTGLFDEFYGWLKGKIEEEIVGLWRRCGAGENLTECADLDAYRQQRWTAVGIRG